MFAFLKKLALTLVIVAAAAPAMAADLNPVGNWEVTTGEARYKVTNCGGEKLCAKLTWLRADARTPANLKLINTYVVKGAAATKTNKWAGEVIFEGQSYDGSVTMVSADTLRLKGCSGILCQSFEFNRISSTVASN